MQKEGQILCAHFPQKMCFHSGDHVLPFFSNLSRLGAIMVRICLFVK